MNPAAYWGLGALLGGLFGASWYFAVRGLLSRLEPLEVPSYPLGPPEPSSEPSELRTEPSEAPPEPNRMDPGDPVWLWPYEKPRW